MMKVTGRRYRVWLFMLTASALAAPATALPWLEIDDAGDLPGIAQFTDGVGPLTSITGTILPGTLDADMFAIFISDPAAFSATTVGTGSMLDTQLFLFDAEGFGIYANDDSAGTLQSTLPANHPLGPKSAGLYFLAISGFDLDPVSPNSMIFPNVPTTAVVGPTGLGGGLPIIGWRGVGDSGSYTIALTGAEFAIPEPATLALVGAGLAALAVRQRRNQHRQRDIA